MTSARPHDARAAVGPLISGAAAIGKVDAGAMAGSPAEKADLPPRVARLHPDLVLS
jgi:hypothetical protein